MVENKKTSNDFLEFDKDKTIRSHLKEGKLAY